MNTETYIAENGNGKYQLVNGNAETVKEWEDYEEAKQALIDDNNNDIDLEWI